MNLRNVLAANLKKLRDATPTLANLPSITKAGGGSNGTLGRIQLAKTGVSIDAVESLATAFRVEPWQLLHPSAEAIPSFLQSSDAVDQLKASMQLLDASTRERAAVLLQGLARDPDGPWATWLTELLAAPAQATQLATTPVVKEPFHYKKINQPTQQPLKRKHQ